MLEPRFFPRADVNLSATLVTRNQSVPARIANLSEGGALVEGPLDLQRDTPVQVQLTLPGSDRPITIHAYVVRSNDLGRDRYGVATTFVDVSDDEAAEIRALVAQTHQMAWDGSPGRIPRDVALRFVPQIRRIARGLAQRLPPQVSTDDLVGAGFVALVELYEKHRDVEPSELEPIVLPRIRWAMLDELRDADPLSRRMRQRARRIGKATRDLQQQLGRQPTHAEVATKLNLSESAYSSALRLAQSGDATSIDATPELELPDVDGVGPEESLRQTESLGRLRVALDALPPRLKHILGLYYGDELTLRQIGNILGVTEARISQLLSDAVKKLRASCADDSTTLPSGTKPASSEAPQKKRTKHKSQPSRFAA